MSTTDTDPEQQPVTLVVSVLELRMIADALTMLRGPAEHQWGPLDGLREHVVNVLSTVAPQHHRPANP